MVLTFSNMSMWRLCYVCDVQYILRVNLQSNLLSFGIYVVEDFDLKIIWMIHINITNWIKFKWQFLVYHTSPITEWPCKTSNAWMYTTIIWRTSTSQWQRIINLVGRIVTNVSKCLYVLLTCAFDLWWLVAQLKIPYTFMYYGKFSFIGLVSYYKRNSSLSNRKDNCQIP